MIILDGDHGADKPDPPFAGRTVRLPDRATLRSLHSSVSLPDYEASQQEHQGVQEGKKGIRRFGRDFWKAAAFAFAIYVALSLVIAVPLVSMKKRQRREPVPPPPNDFSFWTADDAANPLPLQLLHDSVPGHAVRCNVWDIAEDSSSNPLLLSTSQYKLPPQGLVTVRSNISYDSDIFSGINGSLTVKLNQDKKEQSVLFIVNLLSSTKSVREATNVCFTDAGPNRGLTIYTPKQLDEPDAILSFAVQVLLPVASSIDTFKTYLPLFTQTFGNLAPSVSFNHLSIEGTNNFISCGKLSAPQISVKNSLAPIYGTFNVTDSLTLDTVRGAIDANITLTQGPSALQPSVLTLDNGYSPITANVTLATTAPGNAGISPCFVAQAKTFNGAINVDILHDYQTPPSSLTLEVQNALAESNIRLDPKFQGLFNVQTKLDQVTVRNQMTTSGGGGNSVAKERSISFDQQSPGRALGWVGWGPRPPRTFGLGQVEIVSSLSPITLDLG